MFHFILLSQWPPRVLVGVSSNYDRPRSREGREGRECLTLSVCCPYGFPKFSQEVSASGGLFAFVFKSLNKWSTANNRLGVICNQGRG